MADRIILKHVEEQLEDGTIQATNIPVTHKDMGDGTFAEQVSASSGGGSVPGSSPITPSYVNISAGKGNSPSNPLNVKLPTGYYPAIDLPTLYSSKVSLDGFASTVIALPDNTVGIEMRTTQADVSFAIAGDPAPGSNTTLGGGNYLFANQTTIRYMTPGNSGQALHIFCDTACDVYVNIF